MSKQNQSGRGASTEPIIIEVPAEFKELGDEIVELIATLRKERRNARGLHGVNYAGIEDSIAEKTARIEQASHATVLAALEVDAAALTVDGERYRRAGRAKGTYKTLAGAVRIERAIYRSESSRSGKTVDAISLRAGVIGRGWLPRTAQAIALAVQSAPSRDARRTAVQMGRLPYSRASFERVVHHVGTAWLHRHAAIEDAVVDAYRLPPSTSAISVALDRVSVPMEEPLKRPPGRPKKGAPKRPIGRNFRMAYCGTVTLHDEKGESLRTFRFGCMPKSDPESLCVNMAGYVFRILQKRSDHLPVKLLADGAPEMWNLLEDAFSMFDNVQRGVDFWHLIEKLAPATKVLFDDEEAARATLAHWKASLRQTSQAATRILNKLRRSGEEDTWVNRTQPVHEAITYIENNLDRMDYAQAIRDKLPIGSGNVEATCKTLVSVRMKRSGARWKTDTGEHIIRLRALALSDLWDDALDRLHAERRRSVRLAS
jgi:hypothetical protein